MTRHNPVTELTIDLDDRTPFTIVPLPDGWAILADGLRINFGTGDTEKMLGDSIVQAAGAHMFRVEPAPREGDFDEHLDAAVGLSVPGLAAHTLDAQAKILSAVATPVSHANVKLAPSSGLAYTPREPIIRALPGGAE